MVCHELENMKHTVNVNNNTLEVKVKDTRGKIVSKVLTLKVVKKA